MNMNERRFLTGVNATELDPVKSAALMRRQKKGKVSASSSPAIAVSVRTLEAEQTASDRQKALRLFCRAMIRLYIQDQGNPDHGTSLGVL
jgi:hypothetical protein